ncbi:hypothetical protein [Clostridiisalibacter paucivorans]|uniref:hypothetical protein n=1 Tax=Clostridiisalibacter paucivorans TaxID=408753 RepID=UPI000684544D|nr:hypothetical protein [Clostridiisalibacter paucivorans]
MKKSIMFFLAICMIAVIIIWYTENSNEDKEDLYLSVWNVYWDTENVDYEIELLRDAAKEISYFAAYFDSNNNIFIPEKTEKTFEYTSTNFSGKDYDHYLTIVNDKINIDGSSSLKDTKLLYELFLNEKTMEEHIEEILKLVMEEGYDGVEIDYENIKKDMDLWDLFADFCNKLYFRLAENNIKMRIVLGPTAPLQDIRLPVGPDYVMMCYNLYGKHSGPGPKADEGFILDLVDRMDYIEGKKYFAFATGGFDWDNQGEIWAITEKEAKDILKKYNITPKRDEKSKSITFNYIDENNVEHEVWFADGKTLTFWMDIVRKRGNNNFSLWRLNGNTEESLYKIDKYIKTVEI